MIMRVSMRVKLKRRVRETILEWYGHRCAQCGAQGIGVALEIDHIHPVACGGGNNLMNLQVLCRPCNRLKSACVPPVVGR